MHACDSKRKRERERERETRKRDATSRSTKNDEDEYVLISKTCSTSKRFQIVYRRAISDDENAILGIDPEKKNVYGKEKS